MNNYFKALELKAAQASFMVDIWPKLESAKWLARLTPDVKPGDWFCTPSLDDTSRDARYVYLLDSPAAGLCLYEDRAGTVPIGEDLIRMMTNDSIECRSACAK